MSSRTFQNSDGSFAVDYLGHLEAATVSSNGICVGCGNSVLPTTGQMLSPQFSANVTGLSGMDRTFENSNMNFTVDWVGNVAAQTVYANSFWFAGQTVAPVLSPANTWITYYDEVNEELWSSFNGGAYTGFRAPVYNGVINGLGCVGGPPCVNQNTFQNSDGRFFVDYLGNVAAASTTVNSLTSLGQVTFSGLAVTPGGYQVVCINPGTGILYRSTSSTC
jgi:hypothetical protein